MIEQMRTHVFVHEANGNANVRILGRKSFDGADWSASPFQIQPALGSANLGYPTWRDRGSTVPSGSARPNQYFDEAWGYFMRPPMDILPAFGAQVSVEGPYASMRGSPCSHSWSVTYQHWYGSGYAPGAPTAPASTARAMRDFWQDREAKDHLPYRMGGYVRINKESDHAQPDHMNNRHAVKALNAAFNPDLAGTVGSRAR